MDSVIHITSTRPNGERVTLLTVQPRFPPRGLKLAQWRAWVDADHERMVAELEAWIGRGVRALYEAEADAARTG